MKNPVEPFTEMPDVLQLASPLPSILDQCLVPPSALEMSELDYSEFSNTQTQQVGGIQNSRQPEIVGTIALFDRFSPEPMTPEQAEQYFVYTGWHIRSNLIKRFQEEVFVGATFKALREGLLLNGLLSIDALNLLAKYQAATSKKLPVFSSCGERIGVTKNPTPIAFDIWADQIRSEYWAKAGETNLAKTTELIEYQQPIEHNAIASAVAYQGEDGNYGASLLLQTVGRNEQELSEQLEVCIAKVVEEKASALLSWKRSDSSRLDNEARLRTRVLL